MTGLLHPSLTMDYFSESKSQSKICHSYKYWKTSRQKKKTRERGNTSHQEIQSDSQLSVAKYWETSVTELVNLKVKNNKRKRSFGKVV